MTWHLFPNEFADYPALVTLERTWTYQALAAEVAGLCHELKKKYVRQGSRVAYLGKNDPYTIILTLALWRLQAIACPLNTRLPAAAIPQAVETLNARFLAEEIKYKSGNDQANWDTSQIATLLFTSGSSAVPKIACHTLDNHLYSAQGMNSQFPLKKGDRWLLSLPLFHVGGLAIICRCLLAGAAITLTEPATHASLVPTQLYRLLRQHAPCPYQAILIGGAPISLLDTGWNIHTSYAMTEMSSTIALDGKVLPHCEVRIAADREIWVRGKTLFQGYWSKDKGLNLHLDAEGWFATRDLGKWEDDRLVIIGRKDFQFISGGENIQPEEIEQALLTLEGINEALVVPVPDAEFGQRPVAFIDLPLSAADIRQHLQPLLPAYKAPIQIYPFPKGENGMKRERRALQSLAEKLQHLERNGD